MNAMSTMMREINFNIPREILDLAFTDNNNVNNIVTSIDEKIMTNVIRKRLLPDLNLASQETVNIPLDACQLLYSDTTKTSYYIPKVLTDGKSIISVHSMLSGYYLHGDTTLSNHQSSGSSILDNGIKTMNSLDNVNMRQTARIDLISENTILIYEGMLDSLAINLSVVLENDENLNNINPRAFEHVARLGILVTKSYIYNTMVIQINKGQLYGGHELGIIKDIVDDYKDAEEAYREYYDMVWKKVAFMNNEKAHSDYISSLFGNIV